MSRESKLVKNTGIIAIGQLSSKVFTFLLLPLYTSVLVPEDYGTIDALQTAGSLILYFMTLQLESAVFRFLIEKRNDQDGQRECVTSGLFTIVATSIVFTIGAMIINLIHPIPYCFWVMASIWGQAFYFYISNIARGLGDNVTYSLASFVVTITSLLTNIALILGMRIGAVSILIALTSSNVMGLLVVFIRLRLWTLIAFSSFNVKKTKEMLKYSFPLIPNAISWWIANTSDRLLIVAFLGATFNGYYAAANKIPTIYTTIFSVFNLAWSESVSLASNDSDRDAYISKMMNSSLKMFSYINLGIIVCVSLFFELLIGSKYADAYPQVYILLIAIFVNSMCSLLGGILTGFKDSKAIGYTTVGGAIVNFAINFFLIRKIGLYAASLSTLVSYIAIYIFRRKAVAKFVNYRFSIMYILQMIIALAVVSVGYFMRNTLVNIIILCCLMIWGTWCNRDVMMKMLSKVLKGGK